MKSIFALFLVLGIVFQPAFLSAAEPAADAKKTADAAVAKTEAADESDLDAGMEDWELGKDDVAADDEDLKLDEEEDAKKDAAAEAPAPAANSAKTAQ